MNAHTPLKFGKHAGMGKAVRRVEDAQFVTGTGCYTDDVAANGALHAFIVRSPYAHAAFTIGDTSDAASAPGVHMVMTAADITEHGPLKTQTPQKQIDGTMCETRDIPLLCDGVVRHVGDAVAMVVADSLEEAQEAADLIEIDYDMGDAVTDTEGALAKGQPLVYPDSGTNLAFETEAGNADEAVAIFNKAARVTELKLINNRLVCNYMETRACVAEWSDEEDRYTLTVPSQGVHGMRNAIAKPCLNVEPEQLRVVTPDVGGGFGTKVFPYREYPLCLIAAKRLGQKVRWRCERSEHFMSDAHGRDNVVTMRMAMDEDGRFLALDVDLIAAMGAYLHTYGPYIPHLGHTIATGIYDIPACRFHIRGVYTHTVPTDAYRGAGRPEAIYALERLVDRCAMDLGVSPDEIRRRNAIPPEKLPYTTPFGRMYDTGEFTAHMDEAMKQAEWADFDERAQAAKERGVIRGIGMSTFIEACAFAGSEPAKLNLNADGSVTILIGTQSNGQGHKTAYAQFAADALGMDIEKIHVRQGDTDELESGGGTGGSRSIPLGGVSVKRGSESLAEMIREKAADKLEAAPGDLELVEGEVRIVGTDRAVAFEEIAASAGEELKAVGEFKQNEATFPNGTHICEVEIDPATGETEVVNYTIVDDYGVTVNPLLLAGQVHGGVAQAIGQCLHERTVYDDDGQLITASFMDYRMPRADDIPNFSFDTRNVPSTTNALGIKGAGEAGTIGGCPAVMNAVVDALNREYGIKHIDMPAVPLAVWETIQQAKAN